MQKTSFSPYRLRSFVRRNSRETAAQAHARHISWPMFGLNVETGMLDSSAVFNRTAPLFLEIGFGSGSSLLALAKEQPDKNFIGIDTYHPGVGNLMQYILIHGITNLRLYQEDAVDVIEKCLPAGSLQGVLVFFPDPWPKRCHHARRFIQIELVRQVIDKLKEGGIFHLATDWEDYAQHMMKVMTSFNHLINVAGLNQFANRSSYRPIETKFEQRAVREGRAIWELQFYKMIA